MADRADLSPSQLLDSLRLLAARSVRARRRIPALIRKIPINYDSVNPPERWTLGFLVDVVYLRDCWMHRIDIARAVHLPPVLSAHHDGRIVTDVVAESGPPTRPTLRPDTHRARRRPLHKNGNLGPLRQDPVQHFLVLVSVAQLFIEPFSPAMGAYRDGTLQ